MSSDSSADTRTTTASTHSAVYSDTESATYSNIVDDDNVPVVHGIGGVHHVHDEVLPDGVALVHHAPVSNAIPGTGDAVARGASINDVHLEDQASASWHPGLIDIVGSNELTGIDSAPVLLAPDEARVSEAILAGGVPETPVVASVMLERAGVESAATEEHSAGAVHSALSSGVSARPSIHAVVSDGLPIKPFDPNAPSASHHLYWGSPAMRRVLGVGTRISRIARGPFHLHKLAAFKDMIILSGTNSATMATVANFVNSLIGAGVLAFPSVLASEGVIFGPILILLVGLALVTTMRMYSRIADEQRVVSFEGTVDAVMGPRSPVGTIVDVLIIIGNFSTLVAYFVIMRQGVVSALGAMGVSAVYDVHNGAIIGAIALFVVLPLALIRNLNSLAFASILGMVIMITFSFTVLARVAEKTQEVGWNADDIVYFRFGKGTFRSLPIICFAIGGHVAWFPIRAEMKDPSLPKAFRVMNIGYSIVIFLYLCVGIGGYLSFLESTQSNIVQNYSKSFVGILMTIGVVLNIMFTYPLICRPIALAIDSLAYRRGLRWLLTCHGIPPAEWREANLSAIHDSGAFRRQIYAFFLVLASGLVSTWVDDLGFVIALGGSVTQSFITLFLPGALWVMSPLVLRRRAKLREEIQQVANALAEDRQAGSGKRGKRGQLIMGKFKSAAKYAAKAAVGVLTVWKHLRPQPDAPVDEFTRSTWYYVQGFIMMAAGTVVGVAGVTSTLAVQAGA